MTHTITLAPEKEAQLEAQACVLGLTPEGYIQHVLDLALYPISPVIDVATTEETDAWLDDLGSGSQGRPPLSEWAYTREAMYADHD